MRKRVLVVVMGEGTRHMLVGMMLHRGHCAIVGEEGVGRGRRGMRVVRRPKSWMSCPCRVLDLTWMLVGGELVGNARGLLRIVHSIGGESRHSEEGVGR